MGVIEKQSIQDIADAIRDRNGLTTLYKPRQMDEAIRGLYKTEAVNHIFDNLTISTTAQGSSITITDADTTKQASITEIKGKGKGNLIAKDNWELGSISGGGSTMGQNTPATNRIRNIEYIAVEPNTTYTLTLLGDTSTVAFVFEYNSEKVGTKRIPSTWTATPLAFTTQDTTYFVRVIFSTTDVTLGQNVELRKEGDSVVSGDNNVVVSNKNWFNYQYSQLRNINRVTITEETNGFKLTSTGVAGYGFASLPIDNSLLGKQVTISCNSTGNKTPSARLFYHNSSGSLTSNIGAFWTTNTAHTVTLPSTLPSNASGIDIVFYISQSNNASGDNAIFTDIQIEKGTQATSYIAHQGNSYRVDLGGKNIFNIEQAITRMENNAGTLVNGWGTYEDGILTMNRSMGYHGTTCFAGQKFNLEANKTYTLSAIVYLTGTNATSNVILGWAGESNPNVTITKETWTKVSRTVSYTEYKENMRAFIQPSNTGNVLQMKEIMLCEGTDTEYSPYTDNPIELSENDKLWNKNGTWQLNDTEITDIYLLSQLQALENIELYENLCYVDFTANVKADMSLLYYVDGEKILEEIRKE